jgi:hypothetical protein
MRSTLRLWGENFVNFKNRISTIQKKKIEKFNLVTPQPHPL